MSDIALERLPILLQHPVPLWVVFAASLLGWFLAPRAADG